jgi:exopolysaccharide biosynthesis polyprenyl glycosylphosphotransferase
LTTTDEPTPVWRQVVDLEQVVGERTREILERRRNGLVVHRRGWLVRRALLIADVLGALTAFLLSELLFRPTWPFRLGPLADVGIFLLVLPLWIVAAKLYRLYDRDEERTDHSTADELISVFHLVTVGSWLFYVFAHVTPMADPDLLRLVFFWGAAIVLVTLLRAAARSVCRRELSYLQNTVIVGAGSTGQNIAQKALQHPEYGLNIVGFVDDEPKVQRSGIQRVSVIGGTEDLLRIVRLLDVERVIFAFGVKPDSALIDLLRELNDLNVQVDIVPRFFDVLGTHVDVHTIGGLSLLGLAPLRLSRSSRLLKRTMDVIGATWGLVLLAPLFALAALLIKLDSPGPVFFRQRRMGAGEQPFEILKFRTMTADAEKHKAELNHLNIHPPDRPGMFKAANDPRVTRVGRFLRRWSLDELPQLVNVLRGEMSLVGPRPLVLDEHLHVNNWAKKRLDLRPGMTGLWQCVGASDIPFEEMVHLDYRYVTGWSLLNDFQLVLRTIPAVFRRRNAY